VFQGPAPVTFSQPGVPHSPVNTRYIPPARYFDVLPCAPVPSSKIIKAPSSFPNLDLVRYLPGKHGHLDYPAPTAILFVPIDCLYPWGELVLDEAVKHLVLNMWLLHEAAVINGAGDNSESNRDRDTRFAVRQWFSMVYFLYHQPHIRSLTVVFHRLHEVLNCATLFNPLAHLIALHGGKITLVCGKCDSVQPCSSHPNTAVLRGDAINCAHFWRRNYSDFSYAWPTNEEEAQTVPILAPLDTFNPQAENVRCISLQEWRDEVGEALFGLATDITYIVD
jgi:hypothetical protein